MNIVVCVKWVATRPEVNSLTGEVVTDPRFSGFSPADLGALEWALRLSPGEGSDVVLLCVGPPEADPALLQLAAIGGCRPVRIDSTPRPSSQIAGILAAEIAGVADVGLVLCGDYSLDRGTGSVPAYIAHELGWAQALGVLALTAGQNQLTAERRLDQGRREVLKLEGPAVVSVEQGPELRRAALPSLLANNPAVDIRSAAAQPSAEQTTVVSTTAYVPRPRVIQAPSGGTRTRVNELVGLNKPPKASQRVKLEADTAADLVATQLAEWGYLPIARPNDQE